MKIYVYKTASFFEGLILFTGSTADGATGPHLQPYGIPCNCTGYSSLNKYSSHQRRSWSEDANNSFYAARAVLT